MMYPPRALELPFYSIYPDMWLEDYRESEAQSSARTSICQSLPLLAFIEHSCRSHWILTHSR